MKVIKYVAPCFLLLSLFACTADFDWSGKNFPCSSTRACIEGFSCVGGVCIKGAAPNNGKYRPAIATPKVAFLYVGPVGDFGWTWSHEQGRKYLETQGISTTFAGPVDPKDASKQVDEFVKQGYNIIIGTSHDFLVPMLSSASSHKEANHLVCSGFKTGSNIGTYFGRIYQAEWLAGRIAGAMTKTNRIGLVMTIAIPEVVRHINAFTNGVRSVNPNAKVIVKWVGNWFDPKVEPVLTKELLEANTDIIHSHTDTTIPLEVVENAGGEPLKTKDGDDVYTIAYNASNGCDFGPRTCLTSVHWNWGPILKRMVDKVKEGKWDPKEVVWEQVSANQSNSSFSLSTMSKKVPSEVRIDAETLLGKLAKTGVEGQQLPFVGPQVDNTGKERLAKGKQFTDQDLLNMCWFVEGVYNDDATTPAKVPSECRGDR